MKIEYIYIAITAWFVIILSYGYMKTKVKIAIDSFQRTYREAIQQWEENMPTHETFRVIETILRPIKLRSQFRTSKFALQQYDNKELKEHNIRHAFQQLSNEIIKNNLYEITEREEEFEPAITTTVTIQVLKKDK